MKDNDTTGDYERILTSMNSSIDKLSVQNKFLETSITKNEDALKVLNEYVNELKDYKPTDIGNLNNDGIFTGIACTTNPDADKRPFSVNSLNERVIGQIPSLKTNPTKFIEEYQENFLPDELRSSVCEHLDNCKDFEDKRTKKILYYRKGGTYNKKGEAEIPAPLKAMMNMINDKFLLHGEKEVNSIVIHRFQGKHSQLTPQSYDDPSINPDFFIFTLSLGDTCQVRFTDKVTGITNDNAVTDNSLYIMSSQSQLYWTHSVAKPVLSENSARYSITLRSTSRSNYNATIIIGDSNTHNVRFYHENRRSDLGKDIYGKRVKAYTVDEINPADAIGFRNVLAHIGVNNLKNKYALGDGSIDVQYL